VLARGRRDSAVTVVQPHGLTLEEVGYPPDDELADQAARSRVVRTLAP
jgi:tRNA pseudouridine38-40 synthase